MTKIDLHLHIIHELCFYIDFCKRRYTSAQFILLLKHLFHGRHFLTSKPKSLTIKKKGGGGFSHFTCLNLCPRVKNEKRIPFCLLKRNSTVKETCSSFLSFNKVERVNLKFKRFMTRVRSVRREKKKRCIKHVKLNHQFHWAITR